MTTAFVRTGFSVDELREMIIISPLYSMLIVTDQRIRNQVVSAANLYMRPDLTIQLVSTQFTSVQRLASELEVAVLRVLLDQEPQTIGEIYQNLATYQSMHRPRCLPFHIQVLIDLKAILGDAQERYSLTLLGAAAITAPTSELSLPQRAGNFLQRYRFLLTRKSDISS